MNHSIVVQELYQRLTRQSGSGLDEDKIVENIIKDIKGLVSLEKVRAYLDESKKKMMELEEREATIIKELRSKETMSQESLKAKTKAYDDLLASHTSNVTLQKMLEAKNKGINELREELERVKREKEQLVTEITSKETELQTKIQEIQQLKAHLQSIHTETSNAINKSYP